VNCRMDQKRIIGKYWMIRVLVWSRGFGGNQYQWHVGCACKNSCKCFGYARVLDAVSSRS